MSYYRKKFAQSVLQHRSRLRRFLTKVENNPPAALDSYADILDREVWKEVDCLACSNCCRTMTPTFTFKDLQRITAHLGMTIKQFREKWLYKNRQGEWMNRSTPCQFLDRKTNMCNIYAVRPKDCAEFPHLTKKKVTDYIHVHRQNVQHCPATFKWVEKMVGMMSSPQPVVESPKPVVGSPQIAAVRQTSKRKVVDAPKVVPVTLPTGDSSQPTIGGDTILNA